MSEEGRRAKKLTESHGQAAPCPEKVLGTQEYCNERGWKSSRKPNDTIKQADLVSVIPDSSSNAALDVVARSDDILIVSLLLSEKSSRGRKRHSDVEFGDGNFETESSELFQDALEARWHFSDDEVALEADAVEGGALC